MSEPRSLDSDNLGKGGPVQITPGHELEKRIQMLQAAMASAWLDGALILQSADLFYYSGTIQQSHLYIPAAGRAILMVRKSLARARAESRLELILPLRSARNLLDTVAAHGLPRPRRLGLELDVMPVTVFRHYQHLLEGITLLDCSALIREQRAVKSEYELELMRSAARRSERIYQAIPELLVEGIREVELAGQVEAVARREGHQGIVRMRTWNNEIFYGHLMAGESAAMPSYMASPTGGPGLNPSIAQGASTNRIRAGEPLLVDYLFAPDGYVVDQTRIFAIGDLPADLVQAYEAMLRVQAAVVEAARPGVTGDALWQLASGVADEAELSDHFMGYGHDRVRFVGHGVGLELDEYPVLAAGQEMPLEAGMVVALEPKAIFPGRGVMGVENTFVVTDAGLERMNAMDDGIVFV
jgi:Xaa-Pro aminopeptidase